MTDRDVVVLPGPILLPGAATFGVTEDADGVRYAVMNADASKPYLLGTVSRA